MRDAPCPVLAIRGHDGKVFDPGAIQRVVAATDFSTAATAGVDAAIAVARDHSAELVVVHAYEEPPYLEGPYGLAETEAGRASETARVALQKRLDELAASVEGIEVRTVLAEGPASERIVELAAAEAADLVVLATRGLGGIQHLLLGSTAERVIRNAPCPVLAVRSRSTSP